MIHFFLAVLLHFSYLGTGLGILAFRCEDPHYSRIFLYPLAYFSGLLTQVLLLYTSAALGISSPVLPRILMSLGFVGLFYFWWKGPPFENSDVSFRDWDVADWLVLALLAPPVLLLTIELFFFPVFSFDAISIWVAKAKYLFFGENLASEAFSSPHRVHPHPGYPLYFPLFLHQHFAVIGQVDELAVRQGFWIFLMAGFGLIYGFLIEWMRPALALMGLGILLFTPAFSYRPIHGGPSSLYADFPLALLMLFSAGFLVRYLRRNQGLDLVGTIVSLSSILLIKFEGTVWVLLVMGLFAVARGRTFAQRSTGDWLIFAIPSAIFWTRVWAHSGLPPSSDIQVPNLLQIRDLLFSVPRLFALTAGALSEFSAWGLLAWLSVAGTLLGFIRNWRRPEAAMALAFFGQITFAALAVGLLDIQLGLFDYYARASFPRWILQTLPVGLYFALVLNSPRFRAGRP